MGVAISISFIIAAISVAVGNMVSSLGAGIAIVTSISMEVLVDALEVLTDSLTVALESQLYGWIEGVEMIEITDGIVDSIDSLAWEANLAFTEENLTVEEMEAIDGAMMGQSATDMVSQASVVTGTTTGEAAELLEDSLDEALSEFARYTAELALEDEEASEAAQVTGEASVANCMGECSESAANIAAQTASTNAGNMSRFMMGQALVSEEAGQAGGEGTGITISVGTMMTIFTVIMKVGPMLISGGMFIISSIGKWTCDTLLSNEQCDKGGCNPAKELRDNIIKYRWVFYLGIGAVGILLMVFKMFKFAMIEMAIGFLIVYFAAGPIGKIVEDGICDATWWM